ncbi:hypothetical protein [Winogradskyella rapida]|uniref:Uncharacterized protein n=1 Tax=Winogradskyella rapida TaxID=549701 RepID=A0ABW3KQ76_9FLAO
MLNAKGELPPFNSKKVDKYCDELLKVLNDEEKAIKAFKKCIKIIDNSDFDKTDKQDVKLVSKTKNLIDYLTK